MNNPQSISCPSAHQSLSTQTLSVQPEAGVCVVRAGLQIVQPRDRGTAVPRSDAVQASAFSGETAASSRSPQAPKSTQATELRASGSGTEVTSSSSAKELPASSSAVEQLADSTTQEVQATGLQLLSAKAQCLLLLTNNLFRCRQRKRSCSSMQTSALPVFLLF